MTDEDGAINDLIDYLINSAITVESSADLWDPDGDFWYPTVEEIVGIHDDIIAEDPDGEPGIENQERIQYVIDYVKHGMSEKSRKRYTKKHLP